MVILRFIRRPVAYVRYWGWLACWHLTHRRVDGKWRQWWWEDMDYSGSPWVPKHPKAHAVVHRIRKWAYRVRGPYSHRSDFTDPESGVLHGGKGWSEEAFNTFLERIP